MQKLGAEINAQYPDYRETEMLMAMAKREEAREQRQQAESRAQRREEETRLQQQQEEARAQKRREETLVQRKQTEAEQLYARLQTAMDKADWDATLTLTDQIEALLPDYRDVKQLAARARRGKLQSRLDAFSQTLRRVPVWGWIGGVVLVALALFGVFQLADGEGDDNVTVAPTKTAAVVSQMTRVPTPSKVRTRIRLADGAVMVYVPEGTFMMGSDDGHDDEKPVHEVDLDTYWIDKTEVTNAQFAQFVDATGYETTAEQEGTGFGYVDGAWGRIDGADWQHPSGTDSRVDGFDEHPVELVSWHDAAAYCEWAGSRLPTEAEWEKAARWDEENQEAHTYPWGETISCDHANYWANVNGGKCVGDTTSVGSYPNGASPYGALDMTGNVWEWTGSVFESYPYDPDDGRENSSVTSNMVIRGGSWGDSDYSVRPTTRRDFLPGNRSVGWGFRCAQE